MENYKAISTKDAIKHFGIKGMKWGVRSRYLKDRLRTHSVYKKELKNIRNEYKVNKPTLLSKSLKGSGVASLGLGMLTRNGDFTRYGLSAIAGGLTLDTVKGSLAAKKNFKYKRKLLKSQYKKSKTELKRLKNNGLLENKIIKIANNKRLSDVDKQKRIIDVSKRIR